MINVVCVNVGTRYSDEYVINLRNAVRRWLHTPHVFSCITDHTIEGVNCIECAPHLKGWWAKLYLFAPENGLKGTVLYLDLDQVIIGPLTKFLEYGSPDNLVMIHDFIRNFDSSYKYGNSSVMKFDKNRFEHIYNNFNNTYEEAYKVGGDQIYIYYEVQGRLEFWPTKWVKSWKWEVYNGGVNGFYANGDPHYRDTKPDISETSILCFHGKPDPHEVPEVVSAWRGEYTLKIAGERNG